VEIQSVKLVCFSPTGTSKAVLRGIARGLGNGHDPILDITPPAARSRTLAVRENDLLVIAVPVYMGRVPALLAGWLHSIRGQDTPAVCVVVYGNRAYDDALLELKDILTDCGCIPIAGAAFVGEHSFSTSELPTAQGRPDKTDLLQAKEFGVKVREKLLSIPSIDGVQELRLPGTFPYGGITDLWSVDFIEVGEDCIQCGVCAEGCPVGAIDPEDSRRIDIDECITCCACIKNCPEDARTMKAGQVKDVAVRLNQTYPDRKEPVVFL
jgi:ferredoxin